MADITKAQAKERIKKLKETINRHRYLYHVLDTAEISDDALDSLKHELKELEDKFPALKTQDSPTQRVGGKALEKFKKARHSALMLSVEDIFNKDELTAWEAHIKRVSKSNKFEYFCEVKTDGLALAIVYKNGILQRAATRGNGQVGEDVTHNAKTIESIPLKLKFFKPLQDKSLQKKIEQQIKSGTIEVRGEVYINIKDFENFNKKQQKAGKQTYANPRNLAAGSMRQLNPALAASRPLSFMAYDISGNAGAQLHSQEHKILQSIGFYTDPTATICVNIEQAYKYWQKSQKNREKIPYQIDGVVISVNNNNTFTNLGVAGKSPRGMRAFKFTPKQATTVVEDIKVHVGRTGALTPVAVLKPVQIAGVTVSRASLHNFDEIERLDVRVGDTVILERAGDVIPKVVKVLKDLRPAHAKKYKTPTHCPKCKQKLVKKEGDAILYCPNPKCESRLLRYLYYFVGKNAFDIEGLGPKIIEKLIDKDLISDPVDIFTLKKGDLEQLEGFGEKSAQNIMDSINASKKIPLYKLIAALNIRHVGEETAIDLAQKFASIKKLQNASFEDIEKIEGIGGVVAKSVHEWFSDKKNQKFIQKLQGAGVEIIAPKKTGKKLKGKTFVLTGTMESYTRPEAEQAIRSLGGDVASSVSKNTDYVVAGDNPGTKYDKAKKLGVKIINEKQFAGIIK